jgi:hypothetical protein
MTADQHAVRLPVEVPILVKPFRLPVLVDAVRQLLGRPEQRPPSGVGVPPDAGPQDFVRY